MKKSVRRAQDKHFYSHIIETSSLSLALGDIELKQEERIHLIELVDSQLHHVILDTVLSHLSEEDKKIFLQHYSSDRHDEIWKLLHEKVENIEDKIKKAAEDLKRELHKDIKEASGEIRK